MHFGPFDPHAAWKLRVANSSVGLQTYAQSQRFTLDGVALRLYSKGDETIEVAPYRSGRQLYIRAEHDGSLRRDDRADLPYRPPHWAYDFWFSTPAARMSEQELMAEVQLATHRHLHPTVWLFDANWESQEDFLHINKSRFPTGDALTAELQRQGIRPVVWLPPWVPAGSKVWHFF